MQICSPSELYVYVYKVWATVSINWAKIGTEKGHQFIKSCQEVTTKDTSKRRADWNNGGGGGGWGRNWRPKNKLP